MKKCWVIFKFMELYSLVYYIVIVINIMKILISLIVLSHILSCSSYHNYKCLSKYLRDCKYRLISNDQSISNHHAIYSNSKLSDNQHNNELNVLTTTKTSSIIAFMFMFITTFHSSPAYSIDTINNIDTTSSSISSIIDSPEQISSMDKEILAKDFVTKLENTRPLNSDEFIIPFNDNNLGIKLVENYYQGFPIVSIKQIINPELALKYPQLKEGVIITQVNNEKCDGISLIKIVDIIKASTTRPINIKFRDPNLFFQQLDSTLGPPRRIISSSYLPANARDVGAPEQLIIVERLSMPPPEERIRASQLLDVMEIQYIAQLQSNELLDNLVIVDSSAERSAPGTSAKSIYYILGQQNGPPGKFPPGWDLTLQGMVVGEKRKITLPYTLAYDRKGDKAHNIPPFATIIYTVKLISLT